VVEARKPQGFAGLRGRPEPALAARREAQPARPRASARHVHQACDRLFEQSSRSERREFGRGPACEHRNEARRAAVSAPARRPRGSAVRTRHREH